VAPRDAPPERSSRRALRPHGRRLSCRAKRGFVQQAPGAQQKRNWAFISVRPDWLDTKEVLGFYNLLTNGYEMRPFLELLLRAHRECIEGKPPRPFFVILDEMNIARIEHYFADLLSVTESRLGDGKVVTEESLDLHRQSRCLALGLGGNTSLPAKCGLCNGTDEEVAGCPLYLDGNQLVPRRLRMPRNVYITGTVNVDETTHMFSPKVLDRANVIEFNEVLLEDAPEAAGHQSGFVLKHGGVDLGGFQETAKWKHFAKAPGNTRQWIRDVNALLERHGLHFGYRVANEIALFVAHANEAVGSGALEVALDLQMLQKILPKLHGSRQKLERPLWDLLVFAVLGANPPAELGEFNEERFHEWAEALAGDNPVPVSSNDKREPLMPRSARKLARMLQTAITEGFVSFIQ
jgi:5-methylcytosine-specific restriction endonuclease McrBC GTP-binding regulatory subunit McrB